jgi:hypothetical protein
MRHRPHVRFATPTATEGGGARLSCRPDPRVIGPRRSPYLRILGRGLRPAGLVQRRRRRSLLGDRGSPAPSARALGSVPKHKPRPPGRSALKALAGKAASRLIPGGTPVAGSAAKEAPADLVPWAPMLLPGTNRRSSEDAVATSGRAIPYVALRAPGSSPAGDCYWAQAEARAGAGGRLLSVEGESPARPGRLSKAQVRRADGQWGQRTSARSPLGSSPTPTPK